MHLMISAGEHQLLRFFHPHALNILCQLSIYIHSPAATSLPFATTPTLYSPTHTQILISHSTSCAVHHLRPTSAIAARLHSLLRLFLPFFAVLPVRSQPPEKRREEREKEGRQTGPRRAGQKRMQAAKGGGRRRETEAAEGKK